MKHLLRADPGLPRRFPNNLHLDRYMPAPFTPNSFHPG
jgi:hypothetical protein